MIDLRKRIGILGAGVVGKTLAVGFVKNDYKVVIGTQNPEPLRAWSEAQPYDIEVGSFERAAHFGDILVLCVRGEIAEFILDLAGVAKCHHKIVIDTCNPISDEMPDNGVIRFFTRQNESLMEHLQHKYSLLRFVKAFNSVGHSIMVNPAFSEGIPTMFICGNDDSAKAEVSNILRLFGWDPEDMGKVESARAIEALSILWSIRLYRENSEGHYAFHLMKE